MRGPRRQASASLEGVIEAFLAPALRLGRELAPSGRHFQRLMGRMYAEPGEHVGLDSEGTVAAVADRFSKALRKALPKLPPWS